MTYQCAECGETHDELPDIGYEWPDTYFGIPENEREARIVGNSDNCAVDDEHFFIRGVLLIPVHGQDEQFGLGLWISQSRESFDSYLENNDTDQIGPFFGWLSNSVPFYEQDTWALKAKTHFQGNGQRPLIELAPCDHQIYKDVTNGISLEKAWSYVHWRSDDGV